MKVPILVCGCGMRIRAPGARPGRVGRCPACGGRIEVPMPEGREMPAARRGRADDDPGFGQVREIAMTPARETKVRPRGRQHNSATTGLIDRSPMADGFLPVAKELESSWLISFLYPMRGAESLAIIAAIGLIAWVFAVLVPEYCIQAMADASSMGASLIGMLFVWIAVLPIVILGPLVLSYWLQYLGRVLVSSAMGECVPPRTPDRNFDGLFTGLSPWIVWAVLGVGIGLGLPLWYLLPGGGVEGGRAGMSIVLAAAGLPYILASLMLSFLHDDAFAATPWRVPYSLVRLGPKFLALCALIAVALGVVGGGLALTLWLRAHLFWPYLLFALGWWFAILWVQMVVTRLLGVYYFRRKDALQWNRAHPRWGVTWRL